MARLRGDRFARTLKAGLASLDVFDVGLSDVIAEAIIVLARRNPVLVLAFFMAILTLVGAGVYAVVTMEKNRAAEAEAKRLEDATYTVQLQNLQSAQRSLTQLMSFVDSQKDAIKATQDALEAKKAELAHTSAQQAQLRKVAEADRAIVEGLLAAQQQRLSSSTWTERGWGFLFGIAASIIASVLISLVKFMLASRRARLPGN